MNETVEIPALRAEVLAARRAVAAAEARLAAAALAYAEDRTAADAERAGPPARGRPARWRPGEFVADEVSVLLREQPYAVRSRLARTRRLVTGLPAVWEAFQAGEVDAEQVRVIDRISRRVVEPATLAAIDDQVVAAAQMRCPKLLQQWLWRLVLALEPDAFARRHRRALADRRVVVVQGADGMGYLTAEISGADAAAIDGRLAAAARSLGADDPRTNQQRRADLLTDLLLGRLRLVDSFDAEDQDSEAEPDVAGPAEATGFTSDGDADADADRPRWLEVEDIHPGTGELLGTSWQRVDDHGEPIGDAAEHPPVVVTTIRTPRTVRIGVVVPLASLLGASQAPGELVDRSGFVPGEVLRDLISRSLEPDSSEQLLFTRLLTDDGGRLLDVRELGRFPSRRLAEAVRLRAGTCSFPTCTVPADRCDLDHHEPWPSGDTAGRNLDPECRRHHRAKTFAWWANSRDDDTITWTLPDAVTYRCQDQPMPVGMAA